MDACARARGYPATLWSSACLLGLAGEWRCGACVAVAGVERAERRGHNGWHLLVFLSFLLLFRLVSLRNAGRAAICTEVRLLKCFVAEIVRGGIGGC
jgi:hypothetical protein